MFEIVLKQDYEDIFFFRDFEVNGVTSNSPGRGSPIRIVSQSISPSRKSAKSNQDESRLSGGNPNRSPGKISVYSNNNPINFTNGVANTQLV
jgi:hypothetical protein